MRMLKMKQRNLTIKQKIIMLAILSTLIPLLIVGTFGFLYLNKVMENKISDTTSNFLSVIDWNIDTFVADIESSANIIVSSNEIQGFLNHTELTLESYQMQTATRDLLINVTNNKPYINAAYVGNEQNEYLQLSQGQSNYFGTVYDQINRTDWYNMLEQQDGNGVWFKGIEADFIESSNLLMYGNFIRDLETVEKIGVLIISVDKSVFDNMFENINNEEEILILDQETIIYSNENENQDKYKSIIETLQNPKEAQIIEVENKKYILNYTTNAITNWKIVSVMPYEYVVKEFNYIRALTVLLLVLSFLLATISAFLISKKITKQLSLLRNVIEDMEKREVVSNIAFDSNDEIGKVGNRFVQLYNRNSELTVQLYESQLKEKEAELLALQNHINPHFLYNTLNSIFWMAQKSNAKLIAKMAVSLSKIFKLTLNDGKYITTVENEIDQVKSYIDIQNIRFDNKIKYSIDVDPSLLTKKIIKLILQPLVENAVYHGLELKEGNGKIIITGRKVNNAMIFEVIDNGIGFDTEEVAASKKGYALKNINERIKLQYGKNYGMKIESKKNRGTKVIVKVGLELEGLQKEGVTENV
ncbi:sensor histidine kinase [Bacillus solitudinis]|uniref:sensor histidine kinase n=1 Tax=Bacillus solitudinis TaxID=2014074 RepID=UPI000C24DECC|nr:sensor histidine kinase [Bacillus solitudinis]